MTTSLVHTEINRLIASLDGELTSHSRVIDALLDLRCATDDAYLISLVDQSLRNVPGKNSAETEWLRGQLQYLDTMFELSDALGADATAA